MRTLSNKVWTAGAVAVGLALYIAACSTSFYELTSPSFLSWHVVLRKIYSIGAFALVGYLLRRAKTENGGTDSVAWTVLATAAYSAAIEVGQFFSGSKEGLGWNVFDTLCGALGGAIAMADLVVRNARTSRNV